jgi:hypothetical protein
MGLRHALEDTWTVSRGGSPAGPETRRGQTRDESEE